MMSEFNKRSLDNLAQCDFRLQQIAAEAVKEIGFAVIVGHRSDADQQKAYDAGLSKLSAGKSPHNATPSLAFDFIPSPFSDADWKNLARFKEVANVLCQKAKELGYSARWGGTWTGDANDPPAHFADCDHFELHGSQT